MPSENLRVAPRLNQRFFVEDPGKVCEHDPLNRLPQWEKWGCREVEHRECAGSWRIFLVFMFWIKKLVGYN
jgi:hypothetical protein